MGIDAKWHDYVDLLSKRRVEVIHDVNDGEAISAPFAFQKVDAGAHSILQFSKLPMFVVSETLTAAVFDGKDQFRKGVLAMKQSGMLKLPFPAMLLQMKDPDLQHATTFIVLGQEQHDPDKFNMYKFRLVRVDQTVRAALFPFQFHFDLVEDETLDEKDPSRLGIRIGLSKLTEDGFGGEDDAARQRFCHAIASTCFYAVVFGAMVWRTRGVERTQVKVPADTNRLRRLRGKTPIRDYTVLRADVVYNKDGVAHRVGEGGWTMPVHWRCGHWRNVACGPGRKDHRRKWIEPILVNYRGADDDAPTPKFLMLA